MTLVSAKARVAGPETTEPSVAEKREPWVGQLIWPFATEETMDPW